MINFIDEEKVVEKLLKNKKVINNDTYTYLVAYTKYLKQKGISKSKIRDELDDLMYKHYAGFCMADMDTMLQKIVNKYTKKGNYEYKKPRLINIRQDELEFIKKKADINTEHLLFTLLVLAKVNNLNTKDLIVSFDDTDMFKIAKYKYKTRAEERMIQRSFKLNELMQFGYIGFSNKVGSQTIKLKYGSKEYDENGINIFVTNEILDSLMLYYHKWKGDIKVGECEVCGKLFEIKPRSNQKYCKKCRKIKELEKYKQYNKKR